VVEGTVESVSVSSPNTPYQRFNAYFKEDPKHQLAFCETSSDIFRDLFGPNYATTMVGKVVEVEGSVDRSCHDANAGILVSLAHQLRVIGPGVAPLVAHVRSPAENPIPVTNPTAAAAPASPVAATRPGLRRADIAPANPRASIAQSGSTAAQLPPVQAAPERAVSSTAAVPAPTSEPVTAASVAPARVPVERTPSAPAASVRDPLINNVISL